MLDLEAIRFVSNSRRFDINTTKYSVCDMGGYASEGDSSPSAVNEATCVQVFAFA